MSGDHQYRRSFGQKHAGLSQSNRAIRQRIKTLFFKLWLDNKLYLFFYLLYQLN